MALFTDRLLRRYVLLFVICSYFLTAAMTGAVGIDNEGVSLLVRAVTAVLSVALIARSFHVKRAWIGRAVIAGLAAFWFIYLLRIIYDTLLVVKFLSHDRYFYWIWGVGASAVPLFSLAMAKIEPDELRPNFAWMYAFSLLAGVLVVIFGSTMATSDVEIDLVDTGRFRLAALNPILVGQLGCLLAIQGLWCLMAMPGTVRFIARLALIVGVAVGVYLILVSNSRGPIVSFVVSFLFLSLFFKGRTRVFAVAFLVGCVLVFAPVTFYLEENYGVTTYSRILGQSQLEEGNSQARLSSFQGAINDFVGSPFVGEGLEESGTGFYPHNVVLESLMATGMLGGGILISCFLIVLVIAVMSYRREPYTGWIALLYVQFFTGSQFSGSLYTSTYMWGAIGLVVATTSLLVNRRAKAF